MTKPPEPGPSTAAQRRKLLADLIALCQATPFRCFIMVAEEKPTGYVCSTVGNLPLEVVLATIEEHLEDQAPSSQPESIQ